MMSCFLTSASISAQLISEIPAGSVFTPDFNQVESEEFGIVLYDQYANFNIDPKVRRGLDAPIEGKVEDFRTNNLLIHKGFYKEGKLRAYTNYFQNESIEREYKYKADGVGDLFVYYLNGYTRSVQKYYNYLPYHWEDYYDNGVLAYVETKNIKTQIPELIQENNYQGKTISIIEISDNKSLKYLKTIYYPNGKMSEQGELTYIEEIQDFRKDGRYVTYNTKEQITSELVYQRGTFQEVITDNRPDSEKDYLSNVVATAESSEETQEVKSATLPSSKIPSNIIRFDKDQNDEISNKEIDMAVNEFFEDDSITKDQINQLVNYFFEQD